MAKEAKELLAAESHSASTEAHAEQESNVFGELLSQMGDHQGLYIGSYHIADLPIILYDKDGLHFYSGPKSMEEDGLYTTHHHHTVRADNHEPPILDLSITNLMVFQWFAIILLAIAFFKVAGKYKKNPTKAPSGFANFLETLVLYIRDEVVRPNMPSIKVADRLLPYFLGLFFFILVCNLLGLVPGGHTATASISVTAGLAITAFLVINFTAIRESGIGAWFKHLLGGAPIWLAPIMIPIEIMGLIIKPFALTIRLFANMSAGHIILFTLLGLLFVFKWVMAPVVVPFSVFIYFLELLVAFIQAYVFTMLTVIFVSLAIGEHGHDEEHAH